MILEPLRGSKKLRNLKIEYSRYCKITEEVYLLFKTFTNLETLECDDRLLNFLTLYHVDKVFPHITHLTIECLNEIPHFLFNENEKIKHLTLKSFSTCFLRIPNFCH